MVSAVLATVAAEVYRSATTETPKSRLPGADADRRLSSGVSYRNDLHKLTFVHNRGILHAQRAFECRQHVLARDRLDRGQRHGPLDPRVDHEIDLKDVTQQGLGDRVDIGILKVHLDAIAPDGYRLQGCAALPRGRLGRRRRLRWGHRRRVGTRKQQRSC